jgi:hypothetical protein
LPIEREMIGTSTSRADASGESTPMNASALPSKKTELGPVPPDQFRPLRVPRDEEERRPSTDFVSGTIVP